MFRRNNPVSGLQRPESTDSQPASSQQPSMTELPLRPSASTPAAQPLAPRSVASTPAAPGKAADLPATRFGGIPGVLPRRVGAASETAAAQMSSTAAMTDTQGLRKLIVGREITLSGDITTCDILIVEGNIDATLRDGKVLEITQDGHFKGSAEVDEADIGGRFEGNLLVRGRLRLRSTGQIEGTLSYGELEVEAGGRLIGELKVLGSASVSKKEKSKESSADAARLTVSAEG